MDTPGTHRRLRSAAVLSICGAAVALGGCASKRAAIDPAAPPRPLQPPAQYEPGGRRIVTMLPSPQISDGAGPAVVGKQRLTAAVQTEPVEPSVLDGNGGEVRPVKITVKQAAIEDVVRILLGPDGLDRSYVIDPTLIGTTGNNPQSKAITMDIDEEMTTADMQDLMQAIALMQGWTLEDRDGVVFIRPSATTAQNPNTPILEAQAALGTEQPVIRVKRLRFLSAADAANAVKDLVSPGGKLVQSGRSVLIVDTASQANRLARVLASLDVPAFAGVEVWTYRLASRSPEAAAAVLTSIVQPLGVSASTATGSEAAVAFVPIPDSSRLLVIARDPTLQSFVHDLVRQIDQPEDRVARNRYLYRAQYYSALELEKILEQFFSDRLDNVGIPGAVQAPTQSRASNGIRIIADEKERLLLLYATPDDYAALISTLRELDQPKQQVVMTSIIAEVAMTNTLEYGVEYFLRGLDKEGLGILELAGGASDLVSGVPTGSAIFTAADGFAVIQALERQTDVNILSQPNLTAQDGKAAEIQVGGETPIPEGDIDTETGGLRRDITYKDIGIILKITPTINESGDVTMEIDQNIADVLAQSELGPEFTTRRIVTTVTVPHGQTLLMGGIIQTETTDNERRIPLVGSIPIVGEAFKSRLLTKERRELLLAITPRVVSAPRYAQQTLSEFLVAAQGVSEAMRDNVEYLPRAVLFTPAEATPVLVTPISAPAPVAPAESPAQVPPTR